MHKVNDLPEMDSMQWFAVLARDLAEQPDQDAAAQRLLTLITTATGCSAASLVRLSPAGELICDHATDPGLTNAISAISISTGEGVAWEALRQRAAIRVDDLNTETRWPRYTAQVRDQTSIRSILGYCLILDNLVLGAMLLYSPEPGFFTDAVYRFAGVYADHAAIALSRVAEHDRAENLQAALHNNRLTGIAVGILMMRYALSEQAAFDLLRVTSQHERRKLRHIVAEIIGAQNQVGRTEPATPLPA
jgi:transcriptional regulator with GAF, ATPase, and Fis domain